MKKLTKLIIIRHGQSVGNLMGIFLGHTDLDLSELGYLQAETTANHLYNEKIDVIYSSDLKRAYNTAVPNAKLHNLDIKTSKNLREAYVGDWENKARTEILSIWGEKVFKNDWAENFGTFAFPNGEAISDAGKRFYNEILSICRENEGKTILITAHAAVIRAFWAIISNVSWENLAKQIPFASNASYSVAYYKENAIFPDKYSCDEHLSEVGITKVNLT